MLVANSFDLWKKDGFFSAAEEVQQSTDILESAYRTWFSAKRDGISSNDLEELRRELQTALGTAKWQLDEFEKAVRSSYGNCRDQNIMVRHQQFIVAIETQISRAEDALRESFNEGKQPFRWVNLNEDECDDLAMFLSGFPGTPSKNIDVSRTLDRENMCQKQDLVCAPCSRSSSAGSNILKNGLSPSKDEIVIDIGQSDYVMEMSTREASSSTKRAQGLSKIGSLIILISDEDDQSHQTHNLLRGTDTPKERGSRLTNFLHFRVVNYIRQSIRRSSGFSSKMKIPRRLQDGSSIRLLIILIISFFLLVLYLLQ